MVSIPAKAIFAPREERQRVMLPARMRAAAGWSDACILNVSSKGLLVFALGSAEPGTFVEIRRGNQLVVARVVWRQNQRIGLSSRDLLSIANIIDAESAAAAAVPVTVPVPVRRKVPRAPEGSRLAGRAIEFVSISLIAAALGAAVSAYVWNVLVDPLASISGALAGG